MGIQFLFALFIMFKYVLCAKRKCDIRQLGTHLRHVGKRKTVDISPQIMCMYRNSIHLSVGRNRKILDILRYNLFTEKYNLKKCFIQNVYSKGGMIKFKHIQKLFAKKKGAGSTKNGRDSNPKNLGVKILGNNFAHAGNIIVRQRGRTFKPGYGVKQGRDFTLIATKPGKVHFFNRVVSIIDVSNPKPMTFRDIYREDPTIITLSNIWTSSV
ncbi:50S ribosomal protein L27, putative [Plasmodium ovale]|uniref:50S ribosomal protein L27, putative n=2 Tax=Plasmodium ovale TaxID=36330 RepID=A0A1D3TGA0_PLAOA|nr:50S ribosomal protein L27, putative [Plasmodium ovale]